MLIHLAFDIVQVPASTPHSILRASMTTYATPVPHDVVKASGTLSRFPTAIHRDHSLCLDAAYKIRDEFVSEVEVDLNAKTIGDYPVLGLVHVVAFTIPECLPERLALMTRFTDFTIMNDGKRGGMCSGKYTLLTNARLL